jgi:hypothetical protein
MKLSGKKILLVFLLTICAGVGLLLFRIGYGLKFGHQHCIKVAGGAFMWYAGDHNGQLPFSTNGFGDALLLLAGGHGETNDYLGGFFACVCAPDDAGQVFSEALKNNSTVPEDKCSRVYVQGLNMTNDSQLCILFDRNSCRGGDHFRSPWGHRVREACLLDGSMEVIPDEKWPEFSRNQVELLVAAGFSRTNALRFYPVAK